MDKQIFGQWKIERREYIPVLVLQGIIYSLVFHLEEREFQFLKEFFSKDNGQAFDIIRRTVNGRKVYITLQNDCICKWQIV